MKKHALMFLALTGCLFTPTPYQPSGYSGGYTDYPAGRGVYYVAFNGNGFTRQGTVTAMWHRRAGELCGGQDRYEIVSRDGSTSKSYHVSDGDITTITKHGAEGYIRCVDANGNVVAAPQPPPAPKRKEEPKPKQEESALVETEEPAWVDPSQPQKTCEMRGARRYCH